MTQYETIVKELDSPIPRDVISLRDGGAGKKLSYLEGWYIIDRLNKVVGHGNWAYTAELEKVHAGIVIDKYGKEIQSVHYIAKVRLVVTIGDKQTEFTDVGYGDGTDKANIGKAHELAVKEAVTDGIKRCARCLGNSMGNGLYDKSGDGVSEEAPVQRLPEKASVAQTSSGGTVHPEPGTKTKDERGAILADISAASAIAIGKKLITREALIKKLKEEYQVTTKEMLSTPDAQKFLNELISLTTFKLA